MRGRDQFSKFRKLLSLMTLFYSLLPAKRRAALLLKRRRTSGRWGMAVRYALLKSLAAECGENVAIYEDVFFYNPQNLHIGKNVSIHPMCYIECGKSPETGLVIGDDVSIAHGVTIMPNTHIYDNPDVAIKDLLTVTKQIKIGSNVWFGAKATVLPGVTIGDGVVIGAGSIVTKDVPDNKVCVGAPAKPIKDRIS